MSWDEFKQYVEPLDVSNDGVTHYMAPHEIRTLIEKAVREEREAVVRHLRRAQSDDSWIDGSIAIPRIERGEHRKS